MPQKDEILSYTSNTFLKEGFYKTTITQLSRELGISKNTIYKYFPSKQILQQESIKYFINGIRNEVKSIHKKKYNAIEKLINMFSLISRNIIKFNEKFLIDLKIHNPEVWQSIDELRIKLAYQNITKIIKQGKKEKIFVDYPEEILVNIFIGSFRAVINPEFLLNNNFSISDAFNYTHKILLDAILSQKGKILLKKLKYSYEN